MLDFLLVSVLPTVGWAFLGFLVVFLLTAAAGSDGGTLSKEFPWQFRLAARMRTPVLVFFVVPLSWFQRLRTRIARQRRRDQLGFPAVGSAGSKAAAERHEANVAGIHEQLLSYNAAGRPAKLRTARANWASMSTKLGSNKGECHLIKTSHLNEIISIDVDKLTLIAEPGVTMGELTDALVPLGLAVQCHVEMESITLGGVAMGFGIETNSHKFGFFQEAVLRFDFLDSYGKAHSVTAASDPELFYAMAWSHGTIGFLTCLEVKLVKTMPYVRLVYEPTYTAEQLTERMTKLAADEDAPHFLEATLYDKDRAVIQAGWYVQTPPAGVKVNPINSFYKPFFFRHVESFLAATAPAAGSGTPSSYEEAIPLKDFLHRFTRSIFWELEDMIPFSNHPLYRCLWGWLGAPEVSLLKLFQGPVIRRASVYAHVVQESIMPMHRLSEGIAKFDEWFGAYPLLVFPVRLFNREEHSGFIHPMKSSGGLEPDGKSGLWVDLGAYGVPRDVRAGLVWDAKASVRAMEHWARDVGGFQALYTDIFCTPKELRQMFDFSLLDKARKRLGSLDAFPDVYDKVKSEAGISDLSDILAAEAAEKVKA